MDPRNGDSLACYLPSLLTLSYTLKDIMGEGVCALHSLECSEMFMELYRKAKREEEDREG